MHNNLKTLDDTGRQCMMQGSSQIENMLHIFMGFTTFANGKGLDSF